MRKIADRDSVAGQAAAVALCRDLPPDRSYPGDSLDLAVKL
jgi:hypothetical protein